MIIRQNDENYYFLFNLLQVLKSAVIMADSSSTQHFVKKEFLKESSSNEKDVKNEVLKESDCDQKDVEKKSVKETGPEEQKDKKKPEKRKKKGENETRVPKKPLVKRFKMIEERKQRFNKV